MSSSDDSTNNTEIVESQPKKELTEREILQIIAKKTDENTNEIKNLLNKIRHFDQFKEDIMAQVDTILAKLSDDTRPSGASGEQPPQKAPITAEGAQSLMETGLKIVTSIGDLVQKFKGVPLADPNQQDPLAQMKYEIGNRVVEKQLNPRISKQSINFEDLLTDH